jgi:hypothetical protein
MRTTTIANLNSSTQSIYVKLGDEKKEDIEMSLLLAPKIQVLESESNTSSSVQTEIIIPLFHRDPEEKEGPEHYDSSSIPVNNSCGHQHHTKKIFTRDTDKVSTKGALFCCCLWSCAGTALGYWSCGLPGLASSILGIPGGFWGKLLCKDCDPDEERVREYTQLPRQ